MASRAPTSKTKLQFRRTFAAPRAKVFEAWTEREKLDKWMCRDVESYEGAVSTSGCEAERQL